MTIHKITMRKMTKLSKGRWRWFWRISTRSAGGSSYFFFAVQMCRWKEHLLQVSNVLLPPLLSPHGSPPFCICTCIYMQMYVHIHICVHIQLYLFLLLFMHVCMQVFDYACIYMCMYTLTSRARTHFHAHTRTHVQIVQISQKQHNGILVCGSGCAWSSRYRLYASIHCAGVLWFVAVCGSVLYKACTIYSRRARALRLE